jgi:hypothetical protein
MGLFKQQRSWYGKNLMRYFPSLDERINDRGDYETWLKKRLG